MEISHRRQPKGKSQLWYDRFRFVYSNSKEREKKKKRSYDKIKKKLLFIL